MRLGTLSMTVATLLLAAGVGNAFAGQTGRGEGSRIDGQMMVQIIGEVKAVDAVSHRVTVVNAQGVSTQLNVGSGVQDLDKLPLGTRVKSTALQPVTLTPVRGATVQEAVPGDKRFVAKVTSVDIDTGVVMLRDADNLPIEVHARDARQVHALKSGTNVKVEVQGGQKNASRKSH